MRTDRLTSLLAPSLVPSWLGLSLVGASVLAACDPVVPPPFVPPRDTSYDADLDAPFVIVPPRDAPPFDAPRPDTPELDAPEDDAGDPDFDGGTVLPLTIDGVLDELEWEGSTVAASSLSGAGAYDGCTLSALRVLHDDTFLYFALDATLCRGVLYLYVDTGAPGVSLALTGLGDFDGPVDGALSRILSLVNLDFSPRYGWGVSMMPFGSSAASDEVGWRELSQDGPHRHFTSDLTECSGETCETRVPRSALGFPATLQLTARIGTADEGSSLALPNDSGAGEAITLYATVNVGP